MTDTLSELTGNWPFPTTVRFGVGRIAELGKAAKRLGMNRVLLVTDSGLADSPMIAQAMDICGESGLGATLFGEVRSNPTGANVAAGLALYQDGGHDGVIAVGGGSAMDTAKAIALLTGQDGDLFDYVVGGARYREIRGDAIAPIVAVPTTAGTGSEMGYAAVISDEAATAKRILYHPNLLAGTVICDPALTRGLPPALTAWTGMDAAVHCLEAYCATLFNPMCDGIAAEGLRIIRQALPRAVDDGDDLEARAWMMAAAAMGAVAFNKGLGAVHAVSHAIGARYDTHHGLTNAVVLPYVLAFNRPAVAERSTALAAYMGLPSHDFDGLMTWVLELREALAIPHSAADLGVRAADLDALAETAAGDVTARENPVPVDAPALRGILENALTGELAG